MKTLKKSLCLVLAVVMLAGMLAVGSSAAFTDAASIDANYVEAINMLEALGVVVGSDGKVDPKANITRAEFAKILYVAATGKTTADAYKSLNCFKDVKADAWYAGYVNYANVKGLVYGVGGDKFDPESNITGYQAIIMVLRYLGYGQNGEDSAKYWEANGYDEATALKFLEADGKDLGIDLSKAATREQCFYYLYKALKAGTYKYEEYNEKKDVFAKVTRPNAAVGTTKLETVFDAKTAKGVVTATDETLTALKATATKNVEIQIDGSAKYYYDLGLDMIGHYVEVCYNNTTKAVYGVIEQGKVLTVAQADVDAVAAQPTNALKTAAIEKLFGITLTVPTLTYGTITDATTNPVTVAAPEEFVGYVDTNPASVDDGVTETAIKVGTYYYVTDADGNVSIKSYIEPATTYVVDQFVEYTKVDGKITKVDFKTATDIDSSNMASYAGYEGLVKDDFVAILEVGGNKVVTKLEPVSGKLTGYTNAAPVKYTVNGTAYEIADTVFGTFDADALKALINKTANFYFYEGKIVYAAEPGAVAVTSKDFAKIVNAEVYATAGSSSITGSANPVINYIKVQAVLADGTVGLYDLKYYTETNATTGVVTAFFDAAKTNTILVADSTNVAATGVNATATDNLKADITIGSVWTYKLEGNTMTLVAKVANAGAETENGDLAIAGNAATGNITNTSFVYGTNSTVMNDKTTFVFITEAAGAFVKVNKVVTGIANIGDAQAYSTVKNIVATSVWSDADFSGTIATREGVAYTANTVYLVAEYADVAGSATTTYVYTDGNYTTSVDAEGYIYHTYTGYTSTSAAPISIVIKGTVVEVAPATYSGLYVLGTDGKFNGAEIDADTTGLDLIASVASYSSNIVDGKYLVDANTTVIVAKTGASLKAGAEVIVKYAADMTADVVWVIG